MILLTLLAALVFSAMTGHRVLSQTPVEAWVIAWEFTPSDDGQVETLTTSGESEVLVDFPPGQFANEAKVCGQDSWAKDGSSVAIYTGAEEGNLTLFSLDGKTPVTLGKTHRMACAGPTTFQFSPMREWIGYINYKGESLNRDFPYGDLALFKAADGSLQTTFDWTTAFALYDDGALMLRFYPDGKGNATEADLDWWSTSGQQRNLTTLEPVYPPDKPDVECGFTSGAVARIDNTAYVLTGQKCETGATNWRLVSVALDRGAVTEIATGVPRGGFFSGNFTTQLIPTADEGGFLMAVPSGLARNTVQLWWITVNGAVTPVLEGHHVIADRFGERLSEGRHMMVAPDGKTLAFVTSTANQEQTLWLLDLSKPGGTPVAVEEMGVNQRIFQYVWAANNTLYFAAGSVEASSLKSVRPGESAQRIARGRFFRVAVSYKGDKIATAEWYANPESVGDDLFKLTLFDTRGNTGILKQGDKTHNQIIPLAIK